MNRTRSTFYAVIAIVLIVVAFSLAGRLLSEARLLQVFVAATVFAGGVVALDFLGILGHHGGDLAGHDAGGLELGGHAGGDHGLDDLSGHNAGDHGFEGMHAGGHAADGHGAATAAHAVPAGEAQVDGVATDGSHTGQVHEQASQAMANARAAQPAGAAAPLLSMLVYLRLFVYFCLGFGPAGWVALAAGWGPWRALLLGVPFGVLSLILARAFFRFQRRDTGAVGPASELLHEQATVIVSLDHESMGKVRVQSGMSVTDMYALAADHGQGYQMGVTVTIVRVTPECVYVR